MIKRKIFKTRGKIKFSSYFQKFDIGNKVAVIREHALNPKFPKQLQGRTGVIENKRGSYYLVKIKDLNKEKSYIIHPAHLKKIK